MAFAFLGLLTVFLQGRHFQKSYLLSWEGGEMDIPNKFSLFGNAGNLYLLLKLQRFNFKLRMPLGERAA